jgi:hypothetical protein
MLPVLGIPSKNRGFTPGPQGPDLAAHHHTDIFQAFKGGAMAIVGLAVTLLGFLLAAGSVGLTDSTGGRMGMVLVGIVLTLVGILGMINPAYQKNAAWKR